MSDTLPPMRDYTAICHTDGCENQGLAIPVLAAVDAPEVVCGPCWEPITDLTAAKETP